MTDYTTTAKVRARAIDYSTSPVDASIGYLINHARGIIDAVTKYDWQTKIAADATKYYIIEQTATDIAAALMVASDPGIATSNSEAALMIDTFWAAAQRGLKILSDERVVNYLKNL